MTRAERDYQDWRRLTARRAQLVRQHRARSIIDHKLIEITTRALRRETRQDKRKAS